MKYDLGQTIENFSIILNRKKCHKILNKIDFFLKAAMKSSIFSIFSPNNQVWFWSQKESKTLNPPPLPQSRFSLKSCLIIGNFFDFLGR